MTPIEEELTHIDVQPRLFPSPRWFAALAGAKRASINLLSPWNKRDKLTHRFSIADVNGIVDLTTPVAKPQSFTHARLKDIALSRHGNWWHTQRVALESAYGRTPFFEFYFPKFEPFFSPDTPDRYPMLWQYLLITTSLTAKLLGLETTIAASETPAHVAAALTSDLAMEPYWQVRSHTLGFISGLSALDLLFNLGPEAALYMRKMTRPR